MPSNIRGPIRTPLNIYASSECSSYHYVVHDDEYSIEIDAYLVDFEQGACPDALFVALFFRDVARPPFLYAPPQGMAGRPYEVAITMALAAYRAQYPGFLPPAALQELH